MSEIFLIGLSLLGGWVCSWLWIVGQTEQKKEKAEQSEAPRGSGVKG